MHLSLVHTQTQTLKIEQKVNGGLTNTIFPKTEALLNNSEYQEALQYVASKKKMTNYQSMMDFLFCELFPHPWRNRCIDYYNDKGKPVRKQPEATPHWIAEHDLKLYVALEVALAMKQQDIKAHWSEYGGQVNQILKAA